MSDPIIAALASAIGQVAPYAIFIALAERVVSIIRKALTGKENYF